MPENKKPLTYDASNFKTVFQVGQMHDIDKKHKKYLYEAARDLFLQRTMVKNPSGNAVPVILPNKKSHNAGSHYRVNPLGHDLLMKQYNKRLAAAIAKGAEK